MKILLIDIETTPNLGWFWGLFNQNISPSQVVERSRVLCFAAKFLHEDKVRFYAEWQKPGHEGMVRAAHQLLGEADVVVGYNSDGFDLKHLNGEFAKYLLGPPAPYQTVDLYKVVKQNFRFFNHKLDSVLSVLSLEGKVRNRGFSLWPLCMEGDKRAQSEMRRYCIGDIYPSLEELYVALRPWIKSHPNANLYGGSGCPTCGSERLHKRGFLYKHAGVYQRYHCQDCGRWSSAGKREYGVDLR